MQKVILYGAGRNARKVYAQLRDKYDLKCFADKDEYKHGTMLEMFDSRRMSVLSLADALLKYPDAKLWITTERQLKFDILEKLSPMYINKEDILNHELFSKKRGCHFAENNIIFEERDIRLCCIGENPPRFTVNCNVSNDELFEQFANLKTNVINSLKSYNDPSGCKNCPYIVESSFSDETINKISSIAIGVGSVCQFKCIYCKRDEAWSQEKKKRLERTLDFILFLKEKRYIDSNTTIGIDAGEITINPLRHRIFETIGSLSCSFLTNGEIYSDEIESFLASGKASVDISVDAGTPKTFAIVKGRDCFEKVTENIRKYGDAGEVHLKYIILPNVNDNYEDAMGFVKLVSELKNAHITLSRDWNGTNKFDSNIDSCLKTAETIISNARGLGLYVSNLINFMPGSVNKDRIDSLFV